MHFRDNQLPFHHVVHKFLVNNDFDGLSAFLQERTEFLTPEGLQKNPMLHLAGRYGSNKMAMILHEQLGENARILAKRTVDDGWTPLHLAAVYGRPELMQTLMDISGEEAPAVIAMTLQDSTQATPLHLAMSEGKSGIVEVLLKGCGDRIQEVAGMMLANEWNALHLAVHCGDQQMLSALINAIGKTQAKAMAQDYLISGMNILHLTAITNDPEIEEIILDLLDDDELYALGQAQVGELDDATPINLSAQYGMTRMLKRLLVALKEKAVPLCITKMANGWNAFMQIAYFGNVEMLQAMIKTLGSAEAQTQIMRPFIQMRGATPFHMVLNRGNVAMTKAMIAAVDKSMYPKLVHAKQSDGVTPLDLAKRFHNDALLDILLEICPASKAVI